MRQSQQERRIATQLLQLRHEKAVICQNRIFREQQYEERRQKDFQEAMDREAVSGRNTDLNLAIVPHQPLANAVTSDTLYSMHVMMAIHMVMINHMILPID